MMLSVKQGGIKYHFLSLWYDSTWDWTLVFQAIGKHSNHHAKKKAVKLASVVEGDQKAPFSIAIHRDVEEAATSFPGLLHFTLDMYLILLSIKQGGIKYHF